MSKKKKNYNKKVLSKSLTSNVKPQVMVMPTNNKVTVENKITKYELPIKSIKKDLVKTLLYAIFSVGILVAIKQANVPL